MNVSDVGPAVNAFASKNDSFQHLDTVSNFHKTTLAEMGGTMRHLLLNRVLHTKPSIKHSDVFYCAPVYTDWTKWQIPVTAQNREQYLSLIGLGERLLIFFWVGHTVIHCCLVTE